MSVSLYMYMPHGLDAVAIEALPARLDSEFTEDIIDQTAGEAREGWRRAHAPPGTIEQYRRFYDGRIENDRSQLRMRFQKGLARIHSRFWWSAFLRDDHVRATHRRAARQMAALIGAPLVGYVSEHRAESIDLDLEEVAVVTPEWLLERLGPPDKRDAAAARGPLLDDAAARDFIEQHGFLIDWLVAV